MNIRTLDAELDRIYANKVNTELQKMLAAGADLESLMPHISATWVEYESRKRAALAEVVAWWFGHKPTLQ